MSEIKVTAARWDRGWELSIPGAAGPVTQVRTLDKAAQQIIDYLDTVDPDVDHSTWTITVTPDDDEAAAAIQRTREATRAAAEAQKRAAHETRTLVAELDAADYLGADIAGLLGITRGRVSQLLAEARAEA
ncbi:hypothetical protein GCM10028787_31570 [Brachybacterium horti]